MVKAEAGPRDADEEKILNKSRKVKGILKKNSPDTLGGTKEVSKKTRWYSRKNRKRKKNGVRFTLPDEGHMGQAATAAGSTFLERAVMITNLWEMIAFPLRWSSEQPSYYRFIIGKDKSSIVSVIDCMADSIVLLNMAKILFGWLRKTTPIFALKLFIRRFGPEFIFGVLALWGGAFLNISIWLWRALAGYRFMRIKLAFQYMNKKQYDITINAMLILGLKFVLVLYVSLHWVACFCWMCAGFNNFDQSTWTDYISHYVFPIFDWHDSSDTEKYMVAMFKALDVITLTGIFYSPPNNTVEMLMACMIMVTQLVLTSYVFGTLLHMLQFKDNTLEVHKDRMKRLKEFCHRRELPTDVHDELVEHFEFQFRKRSQEKQVVKLKKPLPELLSQAVAECMYGKLLLKCQVSQGAPMKGCSELFMRVLATNLQEEYYRPGELLVREGDVSFQLLFLTVGTIHFSHKGVLIRSLDVAKQALQSPCVGEVAFFTAAEQPFTMVVDEAGYAHCLVLSLQNYMKLTRIYPEQHETVLSNILTVYGVDSTGKATAIETVKRKGKQQHLANQGQVPRIRALILKALRNARLSSLSTLIDAAVMGNTVEIMRVVHMGTDIDTVNYDGQTVLHIMSKCGFIKVAALLAEGVDVSIRDRWGRTALQVAIISKQHSVAAILSRWGGQDQDDPKGNAGTALRDAVQAGDAATVRIMLDNKMDIKIIDYDFRGLLHIACAAGHKKITKMLVGNGANPKVVDRWGNEPLMDAINENRPNVVKLLKNCQIKLPEKVASLRLNLAARNGDFAAIRMLRLCGADLNSTDYDSRTAIMFAAEREDVEILGYLLLEGGKPNHQDRWGGTALNDALRSKSSVGAHLLQAFGGMLGMIIPAGVPPTLESVKLAQPPAYDEFSSLLIEETTVAAEQQAEGGGTDIGASIPEEDSAISLLDSWPEVPLIPPTGCDVSETVETSELEGVVEELKDDMAADADGAADDDVEEDSSKAEKPIAEEPKAEKREAEKPKAEKREAEKLKAEKPKAEKPKAEKPKAERPKAEMPKAEKLKAEKPKAEMPKAEKPKAEKPTAEKAKGAWVGGVSLGEILEHKLVKARHTSTVAALSDLTAQIGLPKALATVHRQMDIQAELEGMEGTNAQVYLKPVTDDEILVAHRATMQLIPMVQATAGAFEHLCELQHELATRLAAMRARLAVPLTAHINEPLIIKCPPERLDQLSELTNVLAGAIACFHAKAPDAEDGGALTHLEYQAYLELDAIEPLGDDEDGAGEETQSKKVQVVDIPGMQAAAKKFQAMVMNLEALQRGMDTLKELVYTAQHNIVTKPAHKRLTHKQGHKSFANMGMALAAFVPDPFKTNFDGELDLDIASSRGSFFGNALGFGRKSISGRVEEVHQSRSSHTSLLGTKIHSIQTSTKSGWSSDQAPMLPGEVPKVNGEVVDGNGHWTREKSITDKSRLWSEGDGETPKGLTHALTSYEKPKELERRPRNSFEMAACKALHLAEVQVSGELMHKVLLLLGTAHIPLAELEGGVSDAAAVECQGIVNIVEGAGQEATKMMMRLQKSIVNAKKKDIKLLPLLSYGDTIRAHLLHRPPADAPVNEQGVAVRGALQLVEEMFNLFADAKGVVHRAKMVAVGECLGEVGKVVFNEVFPVQRLPEQVPKSSFYMLLLLYTEGNTADEKEVTERVVITKGVERFRKVVSVVLITLRAAKEGGPPLEKTEAPIVKREPLPADYLQRIVRLQWWWKTMGGGVVSRQVLWWYIADAFVTPKEFAMKRLKPAFLKAFGDTESQWPLKTNKVIEFLMESLDEDRFASKKHAIEMWKAAFDPSGTKVISWSRIQSAIESHHEFHERKQKLQSQKLVHYGEHPLNKRLLPDTWFTQQWSYFVSSLALYYFFFSPFAMAFHEVTWATDWWQVDAFMTLVFAINAFLSVLTAHVTPDGLLVTDLKEIWRCFLEKGGISELLAVPPLGIIYEVAASPHSNPDIVNLLAMNRVFMVQRMLKLRFKSIKYWISKSNVLLVLVMLAIIHILGCIWFTMGDMIDGHGWVHARELEIVDELEEMAEHEAHGGDDEPVYHYGFKSSSALLFEKYLLSYYQVYNTLINHGMVNYVPVNYPEALFTMFILLSSLTVMALIRSYISINMMHQEGILMQKRQDEEQVAAFIARAKAPARLKADIEQFYATDTDVEQKHTDDLIEEMPYYMRVKIAKHLCRDVLSNVAVFEGCGEYFLDALAVHLRERYYAPSQVIFQQDEAPKELFILQMGIVLVTTSVTGDGSDIGGQPDPSQVPTVTTEKVSLQGQTLGVLPFFFEIPHMNSATTAPTNGATVLMLQQQAFQSLVVSFRQDENIIAENCLLSFDSSKKAMTYAKSVASDKSGKKSVKSAMTGKSGKSGKIKTLDDNTQALKRKYHASLMVRLLTAVQQGSLEEIRQMLSRKLINVNSEDNNHRTAIAVAAAEGIVEVVQFLVDGGAEVNKTDAEGNTPLCYALQGKHEEVVDVLLAAGARLELTSNLTAAILCRAAKKGSLKDIMLIHKCGGDICSADLNNRTGLHLAASEGQLEAVDLLLTLGADLNAKDRNGGTPLDDALREGHEMVMKKLMSAGARFDEAKVAGLLCQAAHDGDLNRVKLMCSNGCSPNAGDHNQRTCMHLAACDEQMEIVNYLLSLPNIDVNMVDRTGGSPLDDAYRHNSFVPIGLLQNRGGLRGNHGLLGAKGKIIEAALEKKKAEDMMDRVNALAQEAVKEHSIQELFAEKREALLTSVELIEGAHKRVQSRMDTMWDHISKNGDADIPLLEGVTYLLKQEPHIRFCVHQVTAVIATIETKLQPVLQMNMPKVMKRGNMEASLRRLTHELELYKQAMTALTLLNGAGTQPNGEAAESEIMLTVNSFLLKEARTSRMPGMYRTKSGKMNMELMETIESRPVSRQESYSGSRPVSSDSSAPVVEAGAFLADKAGLEPTGWTHISDGVRAGNFTSADVDADINAAALDAGAGAVGADVEGPEELSEMVKGGNEGSVSSYVAPLSRQTTPSGLVVENGGFVLNGKLGSSGQLRVDSSGKLSDKAKEEGLVKRHFVDDE